MRKLFIIMANFIDCMAKKCNELQDIIETFQCLIYSYDKTKTIVPKVFLRKVMMSDIWNRPIVVDLMRK